MKAAPSYPAVEGKPVGMIHGAASAGAFVGVSKRQVQKWIAAGRLKCIRHSKRLSFFRPSDLVRVVEEIGAEYAAKNGPE